MIKSKHYYLRRSKGITHFIRCKVLLGSFRECDTFRGQEGGEGLERARVSIEAAENNESKVIDIVYYIVS